MMFVVFIVRDSAYEQCEGVGAGGLEGGVLDYRLLYSIYRRHGILVIMRGVWGSGGSDVDRKSAHSRCSKATSSSRFTP